MNPICIHCCLEMRCLKNGVKVAHELTPNHQRSGDKYGCSECGAEALIGFSKPFESAGVPDVLIKEKELKHG